MTGHGTPEAATREPLGRLSGARRILVVGSGGAGKSAFSSALGAALGLRVVHLDRLYWRPGWVEPSPEEWSETVRRLVAEGSWILDGNYSGTLELRLAAADAAVFLDLPRGLCLLRVIQRRLLHLRGTRPDMAPGCPERLTPGFLKYVWRYPSERRPGVLESCGGSLPPAEKRWCCARPARSGASCPRWRPPHHAGP